MQCGKFSIIQLVVPLLSTEFGLGRLARMASLGHVVELLFDVKSVHDLDGFGKQFLSDVLDPRCAVADNDRAFSLAGIGFGRTFDGSRP